MQSGFASIMVGTAGFMFSNWTDVILYYGILMVVCLLLTFTLPESKKWVESMAEETTSNSSLLIEVRNFGKSKTLVLVTFKMVFVWITG